MNKNRLTMLGCSGTVAAMLLASNVANASTIPPQNAGFVGSKTTSAQIVNSPLGQENSQFGALDPNSDKVGDLAIAKFGCDCPSCRNRIMTMLQTGSLTLPQ